MPPSMKPKVGFLVISVHRAEGLPALDNNILTGKGIDAFVAAL